ncbi:hypothetical protein RhiirA5_380003 [Rhizophagus irregularis]|uniref:BTB domain-containing protein n=1 Tax=Rhizophagus irregularis TaxID=588596 RepID=A0A2N0PA09_9GLOM|nr:hypothetical protein RhiirA5_380003 [Rhizophagus irregularis]
MIVKQQDYVNEGDILLRSKDKTFRVHKLILSLSSKLFKDLIESSETSKPSTNENVKIIKHYLISPSLEIYVDGETPELIEGMLSFLYPVEHFMITWDNISDFLRISDKFEIEKNKQCCKDMLSKEFQSNTLLAIKLAEKYSFPDIYKESSKLILDDYQKYSSDPQFKLLSKETRLKLYECWFDYHSKLQEFICKFHKIGVHHNGRTISLREYISKKFPATTLLKPSLLMDMCKQQLSFENYYNYLNIKENYPERILTYEPLFQNDDKMYIFIELDN